LLQSDVVRAEYDSGSDVSTDAGLHRARCGTGVESDKRRGGGDAIGSGEWYRPYERWRWWSFAEQFTGAVTR